MGGIVGRHQFDSACLHDAGAHRRPWAVFPGGEHGLCLEGSGAALAGYFDLGQLVWTTGLNAGQQSQVKQYTPGQFVLWEPVHYNIQAGDEYQVTPGCDKSLETCKNKFDNFVNYGGFPDVPGRDAIVQTPDS